MKLIPYIIGLTIIYSIIYGVTILTGLSALLFNYYDAENFISLLMLIGSFLSIFYTTLFSFLNNTQVLDLSNVKIKFNKFFVVSSYLITGILGLSLYLGVILDITNIGFNKQIYLDMYYLIVQGSLGAYTGNIMSSVFQHTQKIMNNP